MCEYCNINDIDREKVFEALIAYKSIDKESVVVLDDVFRHMVSIYNHPELADYAVKRIENRNVRVTPNGYLGVLAKDIVHELELMVSCRGSGINSLLDGSR